jgi:hypothetical protein
MTELSNLYSDLSVSSDSGVGNGSAVDFILAHTPKNVLEPLVTLNGVKRRYTTDYTITIATKTVSFVTAPAVGQIINITYKYI